MPLVSDTDAPHFNACDSFQLDLSFMPEPRLTEKHVPCLYFRALTHEFLHVLCQLPVV
jgi:hypothetical protein